MKTVPLSELFDIEYGNQFDLNKLIKHQGGMDCVDFVSRSSKNNGVVSSVEKFKGTEPYSSGLITVTLGGTYLLSSFVQQKQFYTAQNIKVLDPKSDMSLNEKLIYCAAIKHNRFRYSSHGREANKTLDNLLVPTLSEVKKIADRCAAIKMPSKEPEAASSIFLNTDQWGAFYYEDIFSIERGEPHYLKNLKRGGYPYISATSKNNGASSFVSIKNQLRNAITLSYDGSIGEAFYQPRQFLASEKIAVLRIHKNHNRELNPYIAFFLIALVKKEKFRYNYGLKWSLNSRMLRSVIKLPVDSSGRPNWDFMESYIKSLPYSSNLVDETEVA